LQSNSRPLFSDRCPRPATVWAWVSAPEVVLPAAGLAGAYLRGGVINLLSHCATPCSSGKVSIASTRCGVKKIPGSGGVQESGCRPDLLWNELFVERMVANRVQIAI